MWFTINTELRVWNSFPVTAAEDQSDNGIKWKKKATWATQYEQKLSPLNTWQVDSWKCYAAQGDLFSQAPK